MSDDLVKLVAVLEATINSQKELLARIEKDAKERDARNAERVAKMEQKQNAVVMAVLFAVLTQVLKAVGIGI